MQVPHVDIVVALPSHDGKYFFHMEQTLMAMVRETRKTGLTLFDLRKQSSILAKSRDESCIAAQQAGATWLLFVDNDMVIYKPDSLLRLMARDVDIVSGLCHAKQWPYVPCASKLHKIEPVFPPDVNPTKMHKYFPRGEYRPIEDWQDGSIVEVDAVGGAFLLIKVSALEKIPRPYFWNMPMRDSQGWTVHGEDYTFCWQAQQAGLKIHVDTSVWIGHEGFFVYDTQNFLDAKDKWLERRGKKEKLVEV